jgi:hypothetical protein
MGRPRTTQLSQLLEDFNKREKKWHRIEKERM